MEFPGMTQQKRLKKPRAGHVGSEAGNHLSSWISTGLPAWSPDLDRARKPSIGGTIPYMPAFFSLTVPQVNPQTVPVMVSPLTLNVKFT
jgi:hypothetical protein